MGRTTLRSGIETTVTALKLIVLMGDALHGVVTNSGILGGKVKEGELTPNTGLAYGAFFSIIGVYAFLGIIYIIAYWVCYKDDCWSGGCFCHSCIVGATIIGGVLYYTGDNLLTLKEDLVTVMQILLIAAVFIYRLIPLGIQTVKEAINNDDNEQKSFSQVALDLVALTVDIDAIFSVLEKSNSDLDIFCSNERAKGSLWGLYAALIIGYIIIIVVALSLKPRDNLEIPSRDFICTIIFVIGIVLVLPFFLVADNQLPLKCEYSADSKTPFGIKLAFLLISFLFYLAAFVYQIIVLYFDTRSVPENKI